MVFRLLSSAVLASGLAASASPAFALDLTLQANTGWQPFAVDSDLAPVATPLAWIDDSGDVLDYVFSVLAGSSAKLTVVDGGFAGDTFSQTNNGNPFGSTGSVPIGTYETSINVGNDFDGALANSSFSRAVLTLTPGSYRIAGQLAQSVTFQGSPLDATAGAIRLDVTPAVPEPETWALMLAGAGAIGLIRNRRRETK